MADSVDTSIYHLGNIGEQGQDAYNKNYSAEQGRQETAMKLQQLGQQTQEATQAFQDKQAVRQAMQQHVDAMGNLDQHAAIVQIAQKNPMMAKQVENNLMQYGIDGAALRAQTIAQSAASMDPKNYAQKRQELIDKGYVGEKDLPDTFLPKTVTALMINGADAAKQLEFLQTQAKQEHELNMKLVDKGQAPMSDTLYNRYGALKGWSASDNQGQTGKDASGAYTSGPFKGLKPGDTFATGTKDLEAQKAGQTELASRQAGDDFKTAKNDLLAAKKFNALLEPYQNDFNKFPVQKFPLLAAEAAKISGGGAPTVEQLHSMDPNNVPEKWAKFMSFATGDPRNMNNGELLKMYKDYMDDLQQISLKNVSTHFRAAEDVQKRFGASEQSMKQTKIDHDREIQGLANSPVSNRPKQEAIINQHPKDDFMLSWARQNPKNPKAQAILKANGVK